MDDKKTDSKPKKLNSSKKIENENGTEKSNSTRSNSTMGSRKKNKKQEWEKYFCYINDKDREQMMKLPDLPVNRGVKSKKKARRSKSVGYNKSIETKIHSEKNNEKENDKSKIKVNYLVEKKPIATPFTAPRINKIKNIKKDKINESNLTDAMDSLYIKPTYKYLMRSMKANL